MELTEVAPGVDIERDILAHMDFKPKMAATIKIMDPRLFRPEIMGIKDEWRGIGTGDQG
jgi:propionate CoA-transferase